MKSIQCTVLEVANCCKNLEVLTDRTIFYPECGGQPGDRGKLGPFEVLDTKKASDGSSILIMKQDCDIKVGDQYELVLDWKHRYYYMNQHTCQHLISGMLYNLFGIGTVAVHLGEDYLTVETDQSSIDENTIEKLVESLNEAIGEGHKVLYHELEHKEAESLGMRRSIKVEGRVRIVEIEGLDRIACGGVHVADISEIRLVNYLSQEQIRGHVRLYFCCSSKAIEMANENASEVQNLNRILNCKTNELSQKVQSLMASLSEARHMASEAQKSIVQAEVDKALDSDNIATIFAKPGADLQHYAQSAFSYENMALLVLCPEDGRTRWLIILKGIYENLGFKDVKEKLLNTIDAKGGGRPPMYQGTASCTELEKLKGLQTQFRALVKA